MYKDYEAFYNKCMEVKDLDKEIGNLKKEWDELTAKLFSNFPKEEIIDSLQEMWTLLGVDTGENSKEDYWDTFVADLHYYYDRMNINRWCRLQLLIGNVKSH